jgi:hypothetical protein
MTAVGTPLKPDIVGVGSHFGRVKCSSVTIGVMPAAWSCLSSF